MSDIDPMDSIRETYFLECDDLLADLDTGLDLYTRGEGEADTIHSIFRAVHSIKGGAGAFGFERMVQLAHIFETVLDKLRSDLIELDDVEDGLLMESFDLLSDLVAEAKGEMDVDTERLNELVERLNAQLGDEAGSGATPAPAADPVPATAEGGGAAAAEALFQPVAMAIAPIDDLPGLGGDAPGPKQYSLTLKESFAKNGHSLSRMLRELAEMDILADANCDEVPSFSDLQPTGFSISWILNVPEGRSREDIDQVFDFALDDCWIERVKGEASAPGLPELPALPTLPPALPDLPAPVASAPAPAPSSPEPAPSAAKPSDAPKSEKPAEKKSMPAKPAPKKPATTSRPQTTIRVGLEKVDRLLNQVGELVINQAMMAEGLADIVDPSNIELQTTLSTLMQLTRDVQESVMAVRAQPVQPLFQKMGRIVRETARETDKKAVLELVGEMTEIDKTIIEKLSDPLTHMIRNAVDHGIESPEKRREAGKSEQGTIQLSAAHRSGKVVIEISDDGSGINREKVREIAVKKGLIDPSQELSDEETDNLIFRPGFSTAEAVSTLSGRGVGMDVVRNAIEALSGRVSIGSVPGRGSRFTISLPLTLAVLDGMLIEIAGQTMVVPVAQIIETLLPDPDRINKISESGNVIDVRGEIISVLNLSEIFQFENSEPVERRNDGVLLLVETVTGQPFALRVDGIIDQRQIVIKSLESNYGSVAGIAAATILGNGCVALIIDVDDLVRHRGTKMSAAKRKAKQDKAPTEKELAHV